MNLISRRSFLGHSALLAGAAGMPALNGQSIKPAGSSTFHEVLGQGSFRYRVNRFWGRLERRDHPVEDCHAITNDPAGRIILLTNDTRNNLLAYDPKGGLVAAWEHRFPQAHGLRIEPRPDGEHYWITDSGLGVVSLCHPDGREIRRIGPEAVAAKYPDLTEYHPTNVAFTPDGDFFVSDGHGSSFIHHFDPQWRYVASFGGPGEALTNLNQPHSVWLDTRSPKPLLLVCDCGNAMLKWFSPSGNLKRFIPLPGVEPVNVAPWKDHLAVASRNGMILILDGADRVISVVGGEPPLYQDGELQRVISYNYAFNHPHDVYFGASGDLHVAQSDSNRTYPLRLERLPVLI